MQSSAIYIRTEPETKKKAQKVAQEIGMSLSALLNAYLKQLIRTKKVEFSVGEVPSEDLKKRIRQAEENYKTGNTSPAFTNAKELEVLDP